MSDKSNNVNIEIERRYLIFMPDEDTLKMLPCSEIVQTYLLGCVGSTERVRKRCFGDSSVYTHTIKQRISAVSRREDEHEIDEKEYLRLLGRADSRRNTIHKKRYCLSYLGRLFEIDIFSFWEDRAIMEIELSSEEENFALPPEIRIIKEITSDKRYTNAALALELPEDPI